MTSFFSFVSKRAMYLDGRISLAHVRCTYLSQVIKSQNKIKYTVVNVLNSIFTEKNQHIKKLINMRCVIKTCKHNIIDTAVASIRLSHPKST